MIIRYGREGKIPTKFLSKYLYFLSLLLYCEKQTTLTLLLKCIRYTSEGTSPENPILHTEREGSVKCITNMPLGEVQMHSLISNIQREISCVSSTGFH